VLRRIADKKQGTTLLLVSHAPGYRQTLLTAPFSSKMVISAWTAPPAT
jgi:hypothetical protein